jgi:hypothetical protein
MVKYGRRGFMVRIFNALSLFAVMPIGEAFASSDPSGATCGEYSDPSDLAAHALPCEPSRTALTAHAKTQSGH